MSDRADEFERLATNPADFISQHQVFRREEFVAAYRAMGRDTASARAALQYHVNKRHLWVVKRGVYAQVATTDEWLLAARLTPDAVISHDGALSLRGLTPLAQRVSFLTAHRAKPTIYEDLVCQPIRVSADNLGQRVEIINRFGLPITVTTLNRTLVDCLDRLDRAPDLEELLGAFLATEHETSADEMIAWALTFDSPLLCSRLAFFLKCGRRNLTPHQEDDLKQASLKAPGYFNRTAKTRHDKLIPSLNLIVPPELARRWRHNR